MPRRKISKIVALPDGFIGKEDRARLESFGGHLIGRGNATRWHWARERGRVVTFEIFRGGAHEELFVSINRDRAQHAFIARNARGRKIERGPLERVMATVDELAGGSSGNRPA